MLAYQDRFQLPRPMLRLYHQAVKAAADVLEPTYRRKALSEFVAAVHHKESGPTPHPGEHAKSSGNHEHDRAVSSGSSELVDDV
jgi:hypothetical protein